MMKYFVIAGESSGDLHARHLIDALRIRDREADVYYWYRPELAYMGFVSVAMHLPEILRGMKECQNAIRGFAPDRLILVDYPGFNLKIASWFHKAFIEGQDGMSFSSPKVIYYIPPKVWAWKEGRIRQIRKCVDKVLSILPFEVNWYAERYGYHVDYVGNPTLDEIDSFLRTISQDDVREWKMELALGEGRIVALLPGSRRQEIEQNLPMMLRAAESSGGDFRYVIAAAPGIPAEMYHKVIDGALGQKAMAFKDKLVLAPCQGSKSSFMLLYCSYAALVTSGTATLETAIMGVPQAVCYAMRCGKVVSWLRKLILKVPYVSLVNLIAGKEVVPELVAGDLDQKTLDETLWSLLADDEFRSLQKQGYKEMMLLLGEPGAPGKAADTIIQNQ